jgi:hypothetical protein
MMLKVHGLWVQDHATETLESRITRSSCSNSALSGLIRRIVAIRRAVKDQEPATALASESSGAAVRDMGRLAGAGVVS